jgi:hypothetical protein
MPRISKCTECEADIRWDENKRRWVDANGKFICPKREGMMFHVAA